MRDVQVTALLDGIPVPVGALRPQLLPPLNDGEDGQVVRDAREGAQDEGVLVAQARDPRRDPSPTLARVLKKKEGNKAGLRVSDPKGHGVPDNHH